MELEYMELSKELIEPSHIDDINGLLPQLSSSASPVTAEWLDYMFDNGTRLFAAIDEGKIVGTVLLAPMVIFVG